MEIEITSENVVELWEKYEKYKEEFKEMNYSFVDCECFEKWVEGNIYQCPFCKRYFTEYELSDESEEKLNIVIMCEECFKEMVN